MPKIIAFGKPQSGVAYHRIFAPLRALARDNKDVEVRFYTEFKLIPADYWEQASVVIASRHLYVAPDQIEKAANLCKDAGKKLIIDVDDWWYLPVHHWRKAEFDKMRIAERIESTLSVADEVWCTNKALARKVKKFNKNITLVPNAIDHLAPQWQQKKKESKAVRFGYIGGNHHETDLEVADIDLSEVESYAVNIGAYPELLRARHTMETMPPTDYGKLYSYIDVSLIPLISSDFNRCKSHLKLIEAAFTNTAVICSNVAPYKEHLKDGNNCLTVGKHRTFNEAVDMLKNDKTLVKRLAKNLKKDMHPYRMDIVNEMRLNSLP